MKNTLTTLLIFSTLTLQSALAQINLSPKNLNVKEFRTHSFAEYYAVRNPLMKALLDEIDFSNISLSKNYSYSFKIYINTDDCHSVTDVDRNIIFKNDRVFVIEKQYNSKFPENECRDYYGEDSFFVKSYILPKKENFKEIFSQAMFVSQDAVMKSNPDDARNKDLKITLDDTGYIVEYADGSRDSLHPGKALNASMIFADDDKDETVYHDDIKIGEEDYSTKVIFYSIYDSMFAGDFSPNFAFANPSLRHSQKIEMGKEPTLGEFMRENDLL